jgi:hypothetical protein
MSVAMAKQSFLCISKRFEPQDFRDWIRLIHYLHVFWRQTVCLFRVCFLSFELRPVDQ